jgi:alkylresorcinol/alkylpyrone synthase
MYLHALSTALPPKVFSQPDLWEMAQRTGLRQRLSRRSMYILHSILRGNTGIDTRHFAVSDIERVFDMSPDELNLEFRSAAPRLAESALVPALEQARVSPSEVDVLMICTCTGYLCPGLTSYVAERMGFRADAYLHDLVGQGCGAAIPALRAASHALAANPDATIACVAVEVCSAAFYLDDDPGVLISACLFGDGAAATLWKSRPAETGRRCFGFQSIHQPADRDKLRFETRNGKLRNLLHSSVPELAAGAVGRLWSDRGPRPVARIVTHTGGKDVLEALSDALPGYSLEASERVLRACGNMSSPSVLFALKDTLEDSEPGPEGDFWLVSFGAGFSAHACRLGV